MTLPYPALSNLSSKGPLSGYFVKKSVYPSGRGSKLATAIRPERNTNAYFGNFTLNRGMWTTVWRPLIMDQMKHIDIYNAPLEKKDEPIAVVTAIVAVCWTAMTAYKTGSSLVTLNLKSINCFSVPPL